MRSALIATTAAAVLLLTGCATSAAATSESMCNDIAAHPSAYAESSDGDTRYEVTSVDSFEITETHEAGEDVYRFRGVAKLGTKTGGINAEFVCFSQTDNGKTYADITRWRQAP